MPNIIGTKAAQPTSSRLQVMNFLNEIAESYPNAISFASGRPAERFFDLQSSGEHISSFIHHFAKANRLGVDAAFNRLAQYGRTNGIINSLISRQIANDEKIHCNASQVIVTAGCQEAMDLCLTTLCPEPTDVVLARTPTYIGITGVADLNGIPLVPFECTAPEEFVSALRAATISAEAKGLRPRALYLIPDFDNPTGTSLPQEIRKEIIEFCAKNEIVVLEDNPYGLFRFEEAPIPTMFALDRHGCVIYLGTYSKTICPALRVGFAVLPERLFGMTDRTVLLMEKLSQAKSFGTVNTSQLAQAIVGGVLLKENFSLAKIVSRTTQFYKTNRDALLAALGREFGSNGSNLQWNVPAGGFFLTVTTPFEFTDKEAEICARDYGVLIMPLAFFSLNDSKHQGVRLAFSNTTSELISEGISRFARFINDRKALQA
ncbi:(S)-3,5-dihydroxyphenylglycine transaminase [Variovorax paradoxus]|uniref:aminotransferase-like domain-containing protein n=1 Tax=Variovorax paradoxus TaxID=34073 RepID=UPI001AE64DDE|nr:PLP-dependent aminotransferase family protein [Variovorax paradoxus]MDP9968071.1 (S)-3,5-dihydroxyphenylglycine transaminase [Variovorax paradoxus]